MPPKTFSDKFLSNLKGGSATRDIREGRGFGVRVFPSGERTFFFRYTFEGKKKFLNLGRYPDKKLKDARIEANDARELLEQGIDPITQREEDRKSRREELTVADLIDEYLEKHAKVHKKSWKYDERLLNADVKPKWGRRKVTDIKKRDAILLLEDVFSRAPAMSNLVFAITRKMFNFAVERDILEFSPFMSVKAMAPKVERDRHLVEFEIRSFWGNAERLSEFDEISRALKLILVTAQRPGEVIGLHRSEIDGRWWTIPKERSKNGLPHTVFLTDLALELIGEKDGYIFQSPKIKESDNGEQIFQAIAEVSLSSAIRRKVPTDCLYNCSTCDNAGCKEDRRPKEEKNIFQCPHFRPHDLRRTAATNMAALGFTDEVIDAVLNHSKKGIIRTYNLHRYDAEKQKALIQWEKRLRSYVKVEQKGKVIAIGGR